jgi:hypothetical protein
VYLVLGEVYLAMFLADVMTAGPAAVSGWCWLA